MSERYPRIRIHARNGEILIRDGLSICFYMRRSHGEIALGVMRSLDAYLRALGPSALGWYPDAEGDWQELDVAGWEHIRRKLRGNNCGIVTLKDTPGGAGQYQFSYFGKSLDAPLFVNNPGAVCAVEFWLPTEYLEEHGPARVRELAAPLPFNSGHAGLSFNALGQLLGVFGEIRQLCFRYSGMDIRNMEDVAWDIGTRVRGAHWLTFLGQPVLGELGSVTGPRARLSSPDITIQELEGERAVVTLGQWPEAGDTQQGLDLPLHRELARVLEPWLHRRRNPWSGFSEEDMRRWERRFLD